MRSAAQEVHLGRVQDELDEARRIALRRSGARGADARKALVAAERKYQEAAEDLEKLRSTERDWQADAAELFSQVQSLLEAVSRPSASEARPRTLQTSSRARTTSCSQLDASATEPRARLILRGLGFPDTLMSAAYTSLSGGWKSRVSLASALLQPADILLLDEPVNYLDLPAVIWLQRFVNELDHSVVVVSHDRAFLDAVAGELIVLRKEKLAYSDGNLTEYEK